MICNSLLGTALIFSISTLALPTPPDADSLYGNLNFVSNKGANIDSLYSNLDNLTGKRANMN
jgi:hypothetical protein